MIQRSTTDFIDDITSEVRRFLQTMRLHMSQSAGFVYVVLSLSPELSLDKETVQNGISSGI